VGNVQNGKMGLLPKFQKHVDYYYVQKCGRFWMDIITLTFFVGGRQYCGLNLRLCACQADALLLEPKLQPFFLRLFLR
jgi:hypothetical protein